MSETGTVYLHISNIERVLTSRGQAMVLAVDPKNVRFSHKPDSSGYETLANLFEVQQAMGRLSRLAYMATNGEIGDLVPRTPRAESA